MLNKEEIRDWLVSLQERICTELEHTDGRGKFMTDAWQRSGGGGGVTRVFVGGKIIEKGGVNFSAVWGRTPEAVLKSMKLDPSDQSDFFATGVSIVLHPFNPMVPIIHMNVRYFEMTNGTWWFGGGIDLTPHYVDEEDARYFHKSLKQICDQHDPSYYSKFKDWADDYFFLKHRNETRGIGGIFFDYLKGDAGFTKEIRFDFIQSLGNARSEEHTSELQSPCNLVCLLLLEKKKVIAELVAQEDINFNHVTEQLHDQYYLLQCHSYTHR